MVEEAEVSATEAVVVSEAVEAGSVVEVVVVVVGEGLAVIDLDSEVTAVALGETEEDLVGTEEVVSAVVSMAVVVVTEASVEASAAEGEMIKVVSGKFIAFCLMKF